MPSENKSNVFYGELQPDHKFEHFNQKNCVSFKAKPFNSLSTNTKETYFSVHPEDSRIAGLSSHWTAISAGVPAITSLPTYRDTDASWDAVSAEGPTIRSCRRSVSSDPSSSWG